jgi:hypothetical protein
VRHPASEKTFVIAAKLEIGPALIHLVARTLVKNEHADRGGDQFAHRVIAPLTRICEFVQPSEEVWKIVVDRFVDLPDDESTLGGLAVVGTGRC